MIKNYRTPIFTFRKNSVISVYIALAMILSLLQSCQQTEIKTSSPKRNYRKDLPYTKSEVKYAKGFTLKYFDNYKVLNIIHHSSKRPDTLKYALVQRGYPIPQGFTKSQIIPIPIHNLIGMSSVQIAMADFAESTDILTGLANFNYVNSEKVRESIKAGKIVQVGEEGTINKELIISIHPDLIMGTGAPAADNSRYQTLINAGIPVLLNIEWLETTPLGRAEWVKLMAALLNKEELVNKKFQSIEKEYSMLAEIGKRALKKPQIIVGMPFKGSWFVPDGTSFMTRFFNDAGATYTWANIKGTGSMGLSFETVAPIALKADYWINSGTATSKEDIASRDIRYTHFGPYKKNTVYNFNKKLNDLGSNDYWESGVVNPHLVLADLIKILHPELLP
ncbi:MAG: ABC transporter substrate-binding protein, partial [Pyrinomonadaceae bacterium]|nr:ABC transporter substrate-binding protein [Sphingobacteriaceae bacterium]